MTSPGLQQAKSQRAREAICEATIRSLVDVGYPDTTLNRVATAAGFSKGALQHHFPTKEDLVSATLDRLLERVVQLPKTRARPESVEEALRLGWTRYINRPPYRALMEILNAARTDRQLRARISSELLEWGRRMDDQSAQTYEAVSGDDEEVVMLINMTRSFMRGLLLQEEYGVSQDKETEYVEKWIELVAPLLRLRSPDSPNEDDRRL